MTEHIEQRLGSRSWQSLVRHIPFHSMLTEHDVVTRRGELMRIWRLDDAALPADAHWPRERYCLQPEAHERFSIWLHCLERQTAASEQSLDQPTRTVARQGLYISLLLHAGWRALAWRALGRQFSQEVYAKEIELMNAASTVLVEQLADLKPQVLGDYFVAGEHHNEVFDLLSLLVNGEATSRPMAAGPLYRTLPCERSIKAAMNRGLAVCSGPQSSAHPFPDGVWCERVPMKAPAKQSTVQPALLLSPSKVTGHTALATDRGLRY